LLAHYIHAEQFKNQVVKKSLPVIKENKYAVGRVAKNPFESTRRRYDSKKQKKSKRTIKHYVL
jgi:hypothetical protein